MTGNVGDSSYGFIGSSISKLERFESDSDFDAEYNRLKDLVEQHSQKQTYLERIEEIYSARVKKQ